MQPQRPPAVVVIAILSMIGGVIGMVCHTYGSLSPWVDSALTKAWEDPPEDDESPNNADDEPAVSIGETWSKKAEWGLSVYDLLLSTLMMVVGLGLLAMREWARKLALICAALIIVSSVAGVAVTTYGWSHPADSAEIDDDEPTGLEHFTQVTTVFGYIMDLSERILWLAYAVAVLVILLRPSTIAAFAAFSRRTRRPRFNYED